MIRGNYFKRGGKSAEEIEEHILNSAEKQRERNRSAYHKRKRIEIASIHDKYVYLAKELDLEPIDLETLYKSSDRMSKNIFKNLVFDKLYNLHKIKKRKD